MVSQFVSLGARIEVCGGDLFLGKWIPVGMRGTVQAKVECEGEHFYEVTFDGDKEVYSVAPAEIREIEEGGRCA